MPPPYILYRAVWNATLGKYDKLPVDHRSLKVADAHDAATHTDEATARAALARASKAYGAAVVINPPWWFLDLDEALETFEDGRPSVWKPHVAELINALPGAYVETSLSGRGIHIIGQGVVPPHTTKNKIINTDLYSRLRFCALTGTHATGSMDAFLPGVAAVAARWFPPNQDPATAVPEWTDGPCEGWNGPTDDDDLIRRACASRSANATFGGAPSFKHLWEADEAILGKAYPDPHQSRPFDASLADAALFSHLAFWTGKDCARMVRLARRSALARDKWDDRDDYLPRTITRVCGMCREVHNGRSRQAAQESDKPAPLAGQPAPTDQPTERHGLILASDMTRHFAGCVYVESRGGVAVPDGRLLTPAQFKTSTRYGGARFMLDATKTTRNAWEAFSESESWQPPMAHDLAFRPELPSRVIIDDSGTLLFNAYVPIATPATQGDVGPLLAHIGRLLPVQGDRDLLLAVMAAMVQFPGKKHQFAILLQGCEGNGKTLITEALRFCVGEAYCHVADAQDLANKFNAWIDRKLLVVVEEIAVRERAEVLDALKPLITNSRIGMQAKGRDQIAVDNRANFFLTSNHRGAMPKTEQDRRYAVLFCAQQEAAHLERDGMVGSYFPDLWNWCKAGGFAAFNGFLRSYAIPDALNPTTLLHRAPRTSSTHEAIEASRGVVEQAVLEAIETEETGFRGGWVSSYWLGVLLDAQRLRQRCPPNARDSMLKSLGYVKHPALIDGRVTMNVLPDNRRVRLWVREGSIPHLNAPTAAEAQRLYTEAQAPAAPAAPAAPDIFRTGT